MRLYFFPRGVFLRTALIIGLIIGFSLALALWFFARNAYSPGIEEYAKLTALQAQLADKSGWQQSDAVSRIREATGITLETSAGVTREPQPFLSYQLTSRFRESVEELLREPVKLRLQNSRPPALWVSAASFQGHWLRVPLTFFRDYDRYLFWAWGVATPLFAILGGLLVASGMTRSLRRLKRVTDKLGAGEEVTAIRGSRIAEVDAVIHAFNQLVSALKSASEDRVLLLSGVSHDLRTPLTRMRLSVELLPEDILRDGMVQDIEDMDAILEQFIVFIRDGADELPCRTDLNALIEDVSRKYDAVVRLDLGQMPKLLLKQVTLRRLLLNLINNACKYGRSPVEITTRKEGGDAVLVLRDHGEGVDEADKERLLQPFARGEVARTTSGSGLGLAIVQRIVDMHHGVLELANHPEGGLMVTIQLPINPMMVPENAKELR